MGRVLALDTGFSTTVEGVSALISGWMQDHFELNAGQVSFIFGVWAFVFFFMWAGYAVVASRDLFDVKDCNDDDEDSSTSLTCVDLSTQGEKQDWNIETDSAISLGELSGHVGVIESTSLGDLDSNASKITR